ncbi:MAG: hydroxymethylglutaryl-CoA reductase [Gammaproteobacteria bacterium]|nr:hydroxymethylglutaryl-CoA reductase [Gammaproteobacteria bacterium]
MTVDHSKANLYLSSLLNNNNIDDLDERLKPKHHPARKKIPLFPGITDKALRRRWEALGVSEGIQSVLLDETTRNTAGRYEKNIENFIGTIKMPVGVAGPLRVNGVHAQGDYYVPLATTEAALVASYSRGAQLITKAGGCTTLLLNQGVSRAPGFAFASVNEVGRFVSWALSQIERFREIAETTTRFGKMKDVRVTVEGNHVYLNFEYETGDASGQNMVTIATNAICEWIKDNTPVTPQHFFVEANFSGDKKASAQSFLGVRGKKVTTEVILSEELVKKVLHTTPKRMEEYWRMSAIGGVLSGTIGVQGHYANGLAALYIACGQDAACVSESSVGVTRFELTNDGGLYAAVTLPNLIVGTVGGGTGLPSQQACLDIVGLAGAGNAAAFAEVCAAVCLSGELSIIGALCSGHFAKAHQSLARGSVPSEA